MRILPTGSRPFLFKTSFPLGIKPRQQNIQTDIFTVSAQKLRFQGLDNADDDPVGVRESQARLFMEIKELKAVFTPERLAKAKIGQNENQHFFKIAFSPREAYWFFYNLRGENNFMLIQDRGPLLLQTQKQEVDPTGKNIWELEEMTFAEPTIVGGSHDSQHFQVVVREGPYDDRDIDDESDPVIAEGSARLLEQASGFFQWLHAELKELIEKQPDTTTPLPVYMQKYFGLA